MQMPRLKAVSGLTRLIVTIAAGITATVPEFIIVAGFTGLAADEFLGEQQGWRQQAEQEQGSDQTVRVNVHGKIFHLVLQSFNTRHNSPVSSSGVQ